MKRTLRQQLETSEKERLELLAKLTVAAMRLRLILGRRRFNRGQRQALRLLLAVLRLPLTAQNAGSALLEAYGEAIKVQIARPSLFGMKYVRGSWRTPSLKRSTKP